MVRLRYMNSDISGFDELVEQGFDLKSPFRSTLLHLAYWAEPEPRLAEFIAAINAPEPADPLLTFEYRVPVESGRGNPSHTDLMISSENVAVAVEAKYTEPEYDLVSTWLSASPTPNKMSVLEGWLGRISEATGRNLTIETVQDCTYQLIHRTASVCSVDAGTRAVVYHCFGDSDSQGTIYREMLLRLSNAIQAPDRLKFVLYTTPFVSTESYLALQAQWRDKGVRDLSAENRLLLKERQVATFGTPVVTPIA